MEKELQLSSVDVADEEGMVSQQKPQRSKGGLVTMPFIIANEALARMASTGLGPNMILYLMGSYNLHLATATQILLISSAAGNFTPVVAAFIADSYIGRFLGVGIGSIISFLGMGMLWLTAMIPAVQPPACSNPPEGCISAKPGQMAMLLTALILIGIGNGGISCSLAFGADQLNRKDNPNNHRALEIFFTWYYASTTIAVIAALFGIVYIQDHLGWRIGFGVPAALMLISTVLFFLASPLYVKITQRTSLLTGFAQVSVAAYKNRKLSLPPKTSPEFYHHKKDSDLVVPSDKLRFLNKACIIKDHEQDIASDGSAINSWSLCTVDQVEELKAIIKVIPLWSTGIAMSINIGGSFGLLQAISLDRHIISSSNFEVPAGSFTIILIFVILIWIIIYDRVLIPLASKIRGKPVSISPKIRMGLGLFFNFLHIVVAAIFESIRRKKAIQAGFLNNTHGVLKMSAMWLAPSLCLAGIAEAFNVIGQNEFYYKEFPKTMASVSSALSGLAMAAGNLVSSFVFSTIENTTSSGGKEGWISDNINKGHFDKYLWVIAGINVLNILYYLVCSWAYGPTADQVSKVSEENGSKEENSTEFKNVNSQVDDKGSDETSSKEKELTEFKNGGRVEKVFKNISEENGLKEE